MLIKTGPAMAGANIDEEADRLIDALRARFSKQSGRNWSRAATVRALIAAGIETLPPVTEEELSDAAPDLPRPELERERVHLQLVGGRPTEVVERLPAVSQITRVYLRRAS